MNREMRRFQKKRRFRSVKLGLSFNVEYFRTNVFLYCNEIMESCYFKMSHEKVVVRKLDRHSLQRMNDE